MTTIEDRVRAALEARAESVGAADLPARILPSQSRKSGAGWGWRIPVAAAAACATAVGVTYVALHHDRSPAPALADTPHRLTGDVDGDGKVDVVRLSTSGAITVRLGDGEVLRGSVRTPAELVGIADVGASDNGIVVAEEPTADDFNNMGISAKARADARVATVLELGSGGDLDRAKFDPGYAALERTPSSWFWVADGQLYGTFDLTRETRLALGAAKYTLNVGGLAPVDAGEMCWDRAIEDHPSSCRPGHDYRPDIGAHGSLPRIYPDQRSYVAHGHTLRTRFAGQLVEATLSGPAKSGSVLEVTVQGKTYRTAPIKGPSGDIMRLLVPDAAHPRGFAVALYFECCDFAHVYLYEFYDGRLTPVPVAKGIKFGDGFFADGTRYFRTWQGPTGALFTSDDGSNDGYRQHVLADRLVDGELQQRAVGWVCQDPDAPKRWGRCPS